MFYRLSLIGSNLLLLAWWGENIYGNYAALLGGWLVLFPLTAWGQEKAAGLLLARRRAVRARLLAVLLVLNLLMALGWSLGFLGWLMLAGPTEQNWLAAVTAWISIGLGMNQALVGFKRVLDQPATDYVNYGLLGLTMFGRFGLVYLFGFAPLGVSWVVLGLVVALNATVTLSLLKQLRLPRSRQQAVQLVSFVLRTCLFMGFHEIVGTASFSVLYFVLQWHQLYAESSYLNVGMSIFSVAFALGEYLMRVYQPRLARYLKQQQARTIQSAIASRLRFLLGLAAIYLLGLFWVITQLEHNGVLKSAGLQFLPAYTLTVGFLITVMPLFLMTEIVNYVMENLSVGSLLITGLATLGGFIATAALAIGLTPGFGALGAVAALAAGEIAHCLTVFIFLRGYVKKPEPLSAQNT